MALAAGTLAVTALYLGLNAAFLHAAPAAMLAGQLNVAQVAAQAVFGQEGGRVVAGIIALGLISAISAMTWAGPGWPWSSARLPARFRLAAGPHRGWHPRRGGARAELAHAPPAPDHSF